MLGLILGIAIVWGIAIFMQRGTEMEIEDVAKNIPQANENISITNPLANAEILSSLSIEGNAKGTWFFEAVAFVKVVDEKGTELGSGNIQAMGDWMTENFVPFKGLISFEKTSSEKGFLIFEKSNPSGMKANSEEFKLPIKFKK